MQPLETRVYKYKNPAVKFFCPLCRTERAITVKSRLTKRNYLQIILTSMVASMCLYPVLNVRAFISVFFIWALFELVVRTDFKKQVPCPHCGFDATWYKKDVKVAKNLVKDFWADKDQNSSNATPKKA